jgi:hypothetical protein
MGLIDSIIGVESGGNPNAQNPNSSASGPGQFIDSTWLSMLRQHRPDITGSDAELLALKSDPTLSREMTGAYAADNQAILSKNGLPVTPGNTYLAHFAGPQGAVKVLQADPNASVGDVLRASVVRANPFLAGMTAQSLQDWASRKMGRSGPSPQPAPVSPATPLNAIPQQPPPIFAQQPQQQAASQEQPSAFAQMPAPQMAQAQPIFAAPRRPIDLSKLRAAFSQPNFYGRG